MTYQELESILNMLISPDDEVHELGKQIMLTSKFYKQYKSERLYWLTAYTHEELDLKTFVDYSSTRENRTTNRNRTKALVNRILLLHKY